MAYEKSWSRSFNNTLAATTALSFTQWQVWSFKALLTGGLGGLTSGVWSVVSSSDAVAAGNNDNVDYWTTTFTPSKLVRSAVGANPKSWIVLKSPATLNGIALYLTISMQGATDDLAPVFASKTAPTGGTVNVRPSSAVEWAVGIAGGSWNAAPTNVDCRTNMCLASDGSFYFFTVQGGIMRAGQALCVVAPVGCAGGDNFPVWTYLYRDNVNGAFVQSQMNSVGITQSTLTSGGLAAGNGIMTAVGSYAGAEMPDILTAKMATLPAWVIVNATAGGTWHMRGRLPDVFVVPTGSTPLGAGLQIHDEGNNLTHVSVGGCLVLPAASVPNFS